jgi:hypothetical protein
MYDGYVLTADPGQSFNVSGFLRRVGQLKYVTRHPGAANEYLVTAAPELAQHLSEMLGRDPDAELPPIGIVEVSPTRVVVNQNTNARTMANLRPLVELLVRGVKFSAVDLEDRPIALPPSDPLKPLLG